MVCTQFLSFRKFVHDGIVVLQLPPPLIHVVRFQNLLTGFLKMCIRDSPYSPGVPSNSAI